MKSKTIGLCLFMFWFASIPLAPCAFADEKDYSNEPWERAALYLGAYVIETKSDLKLGGGIKLDNKAGRRGCPESR